VCGLKYAEIGKNGEIMKQQRGSREHESLHTNPNFKMKYPEFSEYGLEGSPVHTSPCMDPFWRSQPVMKGNVRDVREFDFDLDDD